VTRQLELCDAVAGETAMLLATDTDDNDLRSLFAVGSERLGCHVVELIVRSGSVLDGGDPVDNEAVALALTTADLVVDLNGLLVASSAARTEILEQSRVLAVDVGSCAELDHLVAHPGLIMRLGRAEELLEHAMSMSVTSPAGTQLRMNVTEVDRRVDAGTVSAAGELAHWPAGAIWVHPRRSSIMGTIVAMPGDIIHEARHLVRSPIRLEVSAGRINEVLGDSADADILRAHLETLDSEDGHDIAEVGWGMNLTRRAADLGAFEASRLHTGRGPLAAGQINIRTGSRSDTDAGLTLSLTNASLSLDDIDIVVAGTLEGVVAPDIYERAAGS
jgi:2,5-dihydroxypyridine 5,6-dioxygenase